MALYFHVCFLILFWIGVCRCTPKQYTISNASRHQRSLNRRASEGWSEDTVSKPVGGSGSRVVFPKDEEIPPSRPIRTKPNVSLRIDKLPPRPQDCEGMKFCDDTSYPKTYLDNLLDKSGVEFQALFGSDYVENEAVSDGKEGGTLSTRIDQNEGTPLCQSRPDLIYPTKGEDAQGNTRFIINHGNFTQGIKTEKCVGEESSSCAGFGDLIPFGYETYCKQKYIYRKMLALDDDGSLQMILFPLPSCCMCMVVSSIDSLRSRMGFSPRLSKYKISQKFS